MLLSSFIKTFILISHSGIRWFKRDDNMVPPAYTLSPISMYFPDFLSQEKEKQKAAKNLWWAECDAMQQSLGTVAKKLFDKETARKYIMSGTIPSLKEVLMYFDLHALPSLYEHNIF